MGTPDWLSWSRTSVAMLPTRVVRVSFTVAPSPAPPRDRPRRPCVRAPSPCERLVARLWTAHTESAGCGRLRCPRPARHGSAVGKFLWTTTTTAPGSARPLAVTTTDPCLPDADAIDGDASHRCAPAPRYRLLGPPAVRTENELVLVPGARQMLLLALLALIPGRPVDGGFLCDAIWPLRTPPHDPANALQSLVSRLPGLVGADAVVFAGSATTC